MSVDTIHKPGSTTEERRNKDNYVNPLQSYKFQEGKLVQDETFRLAIADQDEGETKGSGALGRLTNVLYNLENLRKREGEDKEE